LTDEGGGSPADPLAPPLDGVTVLDLTRVLSGPFATLVLADLGARIWKVEHPDGGDETRLIQPSRHGESHYFMALNRNKASLAVDLKAARGRDLVLDLARRADVVVENFRPGVAGRLGLGYEEVRAANPGVVYCSISAFGQSGPDSSQAAFDVAVQALSGIMRITGEPGGRPLRAGIPVADLSAGMAAGTGILAGLVAKGRTGHGRHVDVSMLDAMVSMLVYYADRYFMTGEEPARIGNGHLSVVPYGLYPAADGDLVIATLSERYWDPLCRALGRPDLADDPRLTTNADRVEHREEVNAAVSEALSRRPLEHWRRILGEADIPHAPVLSIGETLDHRQVHARGMVRSYEHPLLGPSRGLGPMVHFADCEPPEAVAAPLLGQHTAAVLSEVLGLSDGTIDALARDGVIACGPAEPSARPEPSPGADDDRPGTPVRHRR